MLGIEKQSTGLALHSFNTVVLIMDSLKTTIKIDTEEAEKLAFLFHMFFFVFRTWRQHYPQCN